MFKPAKRAAVALMTAAVLSGLAACGGAGAPAERPVSSLPSRPIWQDSKPKATASRGSEDRAQPEALQSHASDLQSMFDQLRAHPAPEQRIDASADQPDAVGSATPAREHAPRQSEPEAQPEPAPAATPTVAVPAAAPAPGPTETAADLTARLASLLGAEPEEAGPPLRRALRLAALELIQPDVASAELDALERSLLPAEAAALRPVRDLLARLGAPAGGSGPSPPDIASLAAECAQRLAADRPLALPAALLCERVESFGRYTPFTSHTFSAGREHAAILYVEVEDFAQRSGPDSAPGAGPHAEWTTELAQAVDLYHDADGSLQWRRPEQLVRDTARRRRSDYYLVQRITLPATLSVGRYNLKVTVTDRISGRTAQARVPVEIVADPALVQKTSQPR